MSLLFSLGPCFYRFVTMFGVLPLLGSPQIKLRKNFGFLFIIIQTYEQISSENLY